MNVVNFLTTGVVGAGAMGRGIAQIATQAGSRVHLFDAAAGQAAQAVAAIRAQWDKLVDKGRLDPADRDAHAARLQAVDRMQWLQDDGERLLASVANDEDRWPHLSMRSAQFLDAAAQHRLLRLLRWRDVQARSSDRPRSWILDNELAATLARTPPADAAALGQLFEQFPKAPRKLAGAVWQALETPLADEADAPLALPANDSNKQALKKLQDAVAERSRELGLPDGILASRKHLESYLERRQWPAALAGWRQQELESRLQALLPAR
mgnify:CR=1 FL=1